MSDVKECQIWLVVWNVFYFPIQLGIIIPTDFHIFQRGRYTTNQQMYFLVNLHEESPSSEWSSAIGVLLCPAYAHYIYV